MESMIEQKEKLPISQKLAKELAFEMDKALKGVAEMSEEDLLEQDAEYGYFEDD